MLQILTGQWIAGCVSGLARLGIPDVVASGPKSAAEVAQATGIDPDAVYRLMRATAAVGVLSEGTDGRFSQTPLSAVLCRDAQPGLRDMAMFMTAEYHLRGWSRIDESVRTGKTVMEGIYGMPVFEYFARNPDEAAVFNGAMTALSSIEAGGVADAYDFSGIHSITDVAGGVGLLLATILNRNPHLKGTLYEMGHVLEAARQGPLAALANRCSLIAGNMFESIPPGSDAYMMKYIIHDWPDDICIKILGSCRAGVNPGGKLLVIDHVVPAGNEFSPGKIMDIEMLLFPGGKERTETQFRDLLASSGWRLNRIIPTTSGLSIVEGVPA